MTDKERDELKEVIRKDYPGISEAEISFMVSFFEMMQAKTAAYSTVGASETATSNTKNSQGTGNAGGAKGKKKSKADRLVDSSKPSKTYILYASIEQCPVKVFRRIKVPSNLWLGNLGKIFITAFGWAGYHLSQFTKGGVEYTSRDNIEESFNFGCSNRHIDEMTVTVADVLPKKAAQSLLNMISEMAGSTMSGSHRSVTSLSGARIYV